MFLFCTFGGQRTQLRAGQMRRRARGVQAGWQHTPVDKLMTVGIWPDRYLGSHEMSMRVYVCVCVWTYVNMCEYVCENCWRQGLRYLRAMPCQKFIHSTPLHTRTHTHALNENILFYDGWSELSTLQSIGSPALFIDCPVSLWANAFKMHSQYYVYRCWRTFYELQMAERGKRVQKIPNWNIIFAWQLQILQ